MKAMDPFASFYIKETKDPVPDDVRALVDPRFDVRVQIKAGEKKFSEISHPVDGMACPAGTGQKSGHHHRCAAAACDPIVDAVSCCDSCAAGTFSASDGDQVCTPCAAGKYSANGYGGVGSTACLDCAPGKYSEEGSDHCLDCSPIFACSSKKGMFLDKQPDAPPPAPFTMEPFNTAGCGKDTMGEVTTEQQCAA